ERLETARMHKRWSITVASEKVGVSANTFNRWERGLQVPQLSTLDMVCKAINMSPEDLGFAHVIRAKRRTRHHQDDEKTEPSGPLASSPVSLTLATTAIHDVIPVVPDSLCSPSADQTGMSLKHRSQAVNEEDGVTVGASPCVRPRSTVNEEDGSEEDRLDKALSRRRAITTLIGTPVSVLGLAQGGYTKLLHPEEIVSLCDVSIPLSWQLYFEGGLDEVNQTLPGYLSQLTKLVQEPSCYQKRAATLASQGYQLASLLTSQYQNFGTATSYATQALTFANHVEDPHLQAAALIRLALVYFYLKRPQQRLRAYERALHHSHNASPLLQGRAHIGLSEAHSSLGHEQEARHHLELAHKVFPRRCEEDTAFPYTHFNISSLLCHEGIMHLNLGYPHSAWESFTRMDQELPRTLVPNRLELTVRQAMTSYKLGDRDQSCDYLEIAVRSALMTGNQLRYDEAYGIYERLLQKWGQEHRVKELGSLFLNA
ncbi:MAG: helix-turn-helix transcriptional regulator, partial [Ktedonobacteraceae bacterium]|nr:helix-turn-helix transcriptional regulator [Ktedonobacteraceae bacterium]